jgi:hypothetical protein
MADNTARAIAELFEEMSEGLRTGAFGKRVRVGLTLMGSEHGEDEMLRGAETAQRENPGIEVVVIGGPHDTALELYETSCAKDGQDLMDAMLQDGRLDACVTMHYSFPIGVSTVGRVITPARGRRMYVANTTGTSDTNRVAAMIKNAIAGVAVAKACGNPAPTVGILNIEGARQVERELLKLRDGGYDIRFTESARADGGVVMRGNDLLQGVPDVMVMDALTGNVVIKMLSAYQSGGSYEALGDAYGPGVGPGWQPIVNIISRASGAAVVAGAIGYAGACAKGKLPEIVAAEYAAARKAGLDGILAALTASEQTAKPAEDIPQPPVKVVDEEITGVEILALEDAVRAVWKAGIYAASGMGCTGPVIMVAHSDHAAALAALKANGYL